MEFHPVQSFLVFFFIQNKTLLFFFFRERLSNSEIQEASCSHRKEKRSTVPSQKPHATHFPFAKSQQHNDLSTPSFSISSIKRFHFFKFSKTVRHTPKRKISMFFTDQNKKPTDFFIHFHTFTIPSNRWNRRDEVGTEL